MSNVTPAPETHDAALRAAATAGASVGVIDYVGKLSEAERLGAYSYAQRLFGPRSDAAISLDEYTCVVRAGIDEAIRRAASTSDREQAARLTDTANVFSFNLLADLAECWPDDDTARERHHFEEGLRAAEDCVRWRDELGKPPDRKAMGWWGKGMHLLSLGRSDDAVDAFATTCRLVFGGDDFTVSPESSFDQLLYRGYHGIGRIAVGDAAGEEDLSLVRRAFEAQLADEAKREDAQFGLDQLGVVERKIRARKGASAAKV
jgi:hypothetical protein